MRRQHLKPRQALNQTMFNTTQLSNQGLLLFTSLNSAIYAIDLINTPGIDLDDMCRELRVVQEIPMSNLYSVNIDTQQVANIVCYASVFGFYFNITTTQLIGELTAAILGVELGANYTGTSNTSRLCNEIDYSVEPYLGINATAVSSFICQPTNAPGTMTTASSMSVPLGTASGLITAPTGGPAPYANSTGGLYTNFTSITGSPPFATGGAGTLANSTSGTVQNTTRANNNSTSSFGNSIITFATSYGGGYGSLRLPPSPTSSLY